MRQTKSKFSNLEKDIKAYFDYCDSVNEGQKTIKKPYTLSGLLSFLGITRLQFEALCKKRKYAPILLDAKAKIEAFIEENSLNGSLSANASSNSLKYNFGWGEKVTDTQVHNDSITISMENEVADFAQ